MSEKDEKKVDLAIEQADANSGFEGMNLTIQEKQNIKEALKEKKSLLISFYELYHERQKHKGKSEDRRKK